MGIEETLKTLFMDFLAKGEFGSITIHFAEGKPRNLEVRTNQRI